MATTSTNQAQVGIRDRMKRAAAAMVVVVVAATVAAVTAIVMGGVELGPETSRWGAFIYECMGSFLILKR